MTDEKKYKTAFQLTPLAITEYESKYDDLLSKIENKQKELETKKEEFDNALKDTNVWMNDLLDLENDVKETITSILEDTNLI